MEMASRESRILILGGTSPLAQNLSKQLQKRHHKTVEISRSSKDFAVDLSCEKEVKDMASTFMKKNFKFHGVVNFCGVKKGQGLNVDLSENDWIESFKNLFLSSALSIKYFTGLMSRDSAWINISSSMVKRHSPFNPHYTAMKSALEKLSLCLASDYENTGVRFLSVRVGAIDNEKTRSDQFFNEQKVLSKISMRRLGKEEELSELLIFLLTSSAKWINGTILDFDGGANSSLITNPK